MRVVKHLDRGSGPGVGFFQSSTGTKRMFGAASGVNPMMQKLTFADVKVTRTSEMQLCVDRKQMKVNAEPLLSSLLLATVI
ncbi:hypothetical protein D3C87_1992750 [compost metagenome]